MTFKYPQSNQQDSILNSKTEYSRYWMPQLGNEGRHKRKGRKDNSKRIYDSGSLKPVDKTVPIDSEHSDRCDFAGSSHGSEKPEPGKPSVPLAGMGKSEAEVPVQPYAVSRLGYGQD